MFFYLVKLINEKEFKQIVNIYYLSPSPLLFRL